MDLEYGSKQMRKANVVPVELNGHNMSLPEKAGLVPLKSPVIPPEFQSMLEEPDIFLREPSDMPDKLPPWYMCVASWPDIAKQLLRRGLCRAVHPTEAPLWQGQHLRTGLFGVTKPQTDLRRVIIDRRRRNSIERCLRQVLMEKAVEQSWDPERLEHAWRLLTLPHGSQLTEILCSPQSVVRCWSEDARDYFYLLRYASVRHTETIVGFNVATAEFSADELQALGVPPSWQELALALVSPAMGDQKSMEVAQLCHQHILLRHGAMTEDAWITYRWPFPPGPIYAGCYCDDFGQVAIGADDIGDPQMSVAAVLQRGRECIDKVHRGYKCSGLIRKEAKACSEEPEITLWGSSINGKNQTIRGALNKVKVLVVLTVDLMTAKTVSSDELSSLLGHWTYHCMYRRVSLCLLDYAYAWIRRDPSGGKRRSLGTKVRDELLGLTLLWPLLQSDMGAVPASCCFASDATVQRGAVVECQRLSAETATFFWSRRPQKWEEMVRSRPEHQQLFEFPAAARPAQDALLEHVVLAQPWRITASYRFRKRSHINVQELLAFRTAVRRASSLSSCWHRRIPFFVDSQVVANVITRGRSSSHQLNYILQTCLGMYLLCGLVPMAMWIGTHENPSDDPTRGVALRQPSPLAEEAERAIDLVTRRYRWVYLVTKAQWQARQNLWDKTLGFPGEGPNQRLLPLENQGRDLRMRVTEPTMKRYAARVAEFRDWLAENKLGDLSSIARDPDREAERSRGAIPAGNPSWQVQRQWNQLSPTETRTPLPVEVLLALAVCAWTRCWHRTALALLLGFHLLLRPAEIGEAKRGHLTLPSDTGGAADSG
eukprot:6467102-Amphidinium_carterae.1